MENGEHLKAFFMQKVPLLMKTFSKNYWQAKNLDFTNDQNRNYLFWFLYMIGYILKIIIQIKYI